MYILQKKDKPRTAVQSIGPQTKFKYTQLEVSSDIYFLKCLMKAMTALQDPRKKLISLRLLRFRILLILCAYLVSFPRFPYDIRPKIDFRAGYKMCRFAFTKPLV